jgi:hypothetical protein
VSTIRELLDSLRKLGVTRAVVSRRAIWDFVVAVPPGEIDLTLDRLATVAEHWPVGMRVRGAVMSGQELTTVWDVRFTGDSGAPRIAPTSGDPTNGRI